jgi:hypothetical protein
MSLPSILEFNAVADWLIPIFSKAAPPRLGSTSIQRLARHQRQELSSEQVSSLY